jgi:hypothetical protein
LNKAILNDRRVGIISWVEIGRIVCLTHFVLSFSSGNNMEAKKLMEIMDTYGIGTRMKLNV